MHPFCGGLLSQQGGSDPIRGSGQTVYTLEVYTLLYSYISVKFVSLLIIARANSCDVGCSLVLGCSPYTLEEFRQERETEKCRRFFSSRGWCIVLFWVVGCTLPAALIGDSSMCSRRNYCENNTWGLQLIYLFCNQISWWYNIDVMLYKCVLKY